MIRSSVFEEMLVEGYGGAELGLEDDGKGGANITITHVGWDRLWHDPHARALDFSDARHLGMVLWMDRDQLLELYPDADDTIDDASPSISGRMTTSRASCSGGTTPASGCASSSAIGARAASGGARRSTAPASSPSRSSPRSRTAGARPVRCCCNRPMSTAKTRFGIVRDLISCRTS
jgi:hypothetical protein